jgi:ferredoxin
MVSVDQDLCTGCQICASVAPETFEMGDDGLAKAISDEVTPEAEQAEQQCPVDAISL